LHPEKFEGFASSPGRSEVSGSRSTKFFKERSGLRRFGWPWPGRLPM